jgi:PAS domain S-box-containing protein
MMNTTLTYEELTQQVATLQSRVAQLETENQALQNAAEQAKTERAWVYRLLEQLPVAIVFMRGKDHVIEFANDHYYALVGNREVLNKPLREGLPELVEQGFIAMLDNVYRSGTPFSMDEVNAKIDRYRNGTLEDSWHRFGWQPTRDANGTIDGVFYYGIDITDQVLARHEIEQRNEYIEQLNLELESHIVDLHHKETLLQKIINALPAAIYVVDTEGTFLFVNEQWASRFHLMPEQVIGKTIEALNIDALVHNWREQCFQVLQDGKIREREELLSVDGTDHTFYSAISPIYHDSSEHTIIALAGIATDITERKQAIAQLQTFQALVDNSPDAISVTDIQGYITYANPACTTLFGFGEKTTGIHVRDIIVSQAAMEQTFATMMHHGLWQGELNYQRADGSQFPGQVSLFSIADATNQVQAVGVLIRDISEQKHADEERSQLQQQIIDGQRAAIRELSSPLIPITDHVVLMPLIGAIDSQRAQLVMETLLEGVAEYQSDIAILDITGVSVVDTQVANALVQAARAAQLLGARVIITGIGPTMAQTLVHLGADLSIIETRGNLKSGIAYAMREG